MKEKLRKWKRRIKRTKIVQLWLRSKWREDLKAKKLNANPRQFSNELFQRHYHRDINWDNPTIFDEKCMVLKCSEYLDNALVIQCSDKYRVREYVKECGLEHILNDLIDVWEEPSQIDINRLPNQFALKRNNDCGGILVVSDKDSETDLQSKITKLAAGLNRKYGVVTGELHYQKINPCIVCEKYIGEEDGSFPYDYKFYCMNGTVRCVLVCKGRESEKTFDRYMVDHNFQLLDIRPDDPPHTNEDIQPDRPVLFEEMIKIAEKLASPFPFVRVDLYEYQNRVIFGELTFTPRGCIHDNISREGQKLLGDWLEI